MYELDYQKLVNHNLLPLVSNVSQFSQYPTGNFMYALSMCLSKWMNWIIKNLFSTIYHPFVAFIFAFFYLYILIPQSNLIQCQGCGFSMHAATSLTVTTVSFVKPRCLEVKKFESWFYPDFILILSWFYLDKIWTKGHERAFL